MVSIKFEAMEKQIFKLLRENKIGHAKAHYLKHELLNLYNVVKRYKFEFEYRCQITKTYKEIEYVIWSNSEDKAWGNLREENPTARGIYMTKY